MIVEITENSILPNELKEHLDRHGQSLKEAARSEQVPDRKY